MKLTLRKHWSLDEDIMLMTETLSHPLKWAFLSQSFPGRTQHNIKNRFITIVTEELQCKRKYIRDLIKKKSIYNVINQTLFSLNMRTITHSDEPNYLEIFKTSSSSEIALSNDSSLDLFLNFDNYKQNTN